MIPLTVIIITKNEGHNIQRTLESIHQLTDDIIIVDSGSSDDTLTIAKQFQTKIIETNWDGFGANKNKGIAKSKYNWIFSLDADEVVDHELLQSLRNKTFFNEEIAFSLKFNVLIGNSILNYGRGTSKKIRIFNKKKANWSNNLLHEELKFNSAIQIEDLPGRILHYSYRNIDHCIHKTQSYTTLAAEQMFISHRQSSFIKIYLDPIYTFLISYIFRLGFLDGFYGYTYARMNSYYCFLKYVKLFELNKNKEIHYEAGLFHVAPPPLINQPDKVTLN